MHVGERFVRHDRPLRILQVSDFAIQLIAGEATAKNPAEQVLPFSAALIRAEGMEVALYKRFISPGSVSVFAWGLIPVPTGTTSGLSSPDGHSIL